MIRSSSTLFYSYRFNIYINRTKNENHKRKICFAFLLLSILLHHKCNDSFRFRIYFLLSFLTSIRVSWWWWWRWSNQWHRFCVLKYTFLLPKICSEYFLAAAVLLTAPNFVRSWHLIINIWNIYYDVHCRVPLSSLLHWSAQIPWKFGIRIIDQPEK